MVDGLAVNPHYAALSWAWVGVCCGDDDSHPSAGPGRRVVLAVPDLPSNLWAQPSVFRGDEGPRPSAGRGGASRFRSHDLSSILADYGGQTEWPTTID